VQLLKIRTGNAIARRGKAPHVTTCHAAQVEKSPDDNVRSRHVDCYASQPSRSKQHTSNHQGERMTRTLKTLMAVCLGAFLLTGVACENKETEAALKTCKNDLGNEQKKATDQQTTINNLKAQLATAQTKIEELSKTAATAKPDEKAKAGEAKKEEPAKAAKNENKKGKKK
jgi:hypothetical protein